MPSLRSLGEGIRIEGRRVCLPLAQDWDDNPLSLVPSPGHKDHTAGGHHAASTPTLPDRTQASTSLALHEGHLQGPRLDNMPYTSPNRCGLICSS